MGKALTSLGITPAFIFLLLFVILLFLLYVNVTMKYNRLKSSYMTFMRGKDGKTLEESMKAALRGSGYDSEGNQAEPVRYP